ncbi:hypothetical protein D3C73_995650 [compost metagenome]
MPDGVAGTACPVSTKDLASSRYQNNGTLKRRYTSSHRASTEAFSVSGISPFSQAFNSASRHSTGTFKGRVGSLRNTPLSKAVGLTLEVR